MIVCSELLVIGGANAKDQVDALMRGVGIMYRVIMGGNLHHHHNN